MLKTARGVLFCLAFLASGTACERLGCDRAKETGTAPVDPVKDDETTLSDEATPEAPPLPSLTILSPPAAEVQVTSATLTLEIEAKGVSAVTVTGEPLRLETLMASRTALSDEAGPPRLSVQARKALYRESQPRRKGKANNRAAPATPFKDRFYAFRVPLNQGRNELTVEGVTIAGEKLTRTLVVQATWPEPALPLVRIVPEPIFGETVPLNARIHTETNPSIAPTEILLDLDGDGQLDEKSAFAAWVPVTYSKMGRSSPSVTVRTVDNLLFTSPPEEWTTVAVLPPSVPDPKLTFTNVGFDPVDMEYDWNKRELYILSGSEAVVRILDSAGKLARTISLKASNPQGIGLNPQGDLLVADTGNHRVIKLLKEKNYAPDPIMPKDGAFGKRGSKIGEFESPTDVAVISDYWTGNKKGDQIFVTDTGNNRIQSFNRAGVYKVIIDGSKTPEGALSAPIGMLISGGLMVVEPGTSRIRVLATSGSGGSAFGSPGDGMGQFSNPGRITLHGGGGANFAVADTGNKRVQLLRPHGQVTRIVNVPAPPVAAVVDDTPMGERLLVLTKDPPQVLVIPLTVDPPGEGPVEAAQAYVNALARKDLEAVKALTIGGKTPFTDELVKKVGLDEVARMHSAIRNLRLSAVGAFDRATVDGDLDFNGEVSVEEFDLARHPFMGKWLVED